MKTFIKVENFITVIYDQVSHHDYPEDTWKDSMKLQVKTSRSEVRNFLKQMYRESCHFDDGRRDLLHPFYNSDFLRSTSHAELEYSGQVFKTDPTSQLGLPEFIIEEVKKFNEFIPKFKERIQRLSEVRQNIMITAKELLDYEILRQKYGT